MTKLKNAFSLAEVLIVVAIISVILVMGFSITNRGIDKAYTRYIYTGYDALTQAIREANEENITLIKAGTERDKKGNFVPIFVVSDNYVKYICDLFDGTIDPNNTMFCKAPNGIEYVFTNKANAKAQYVTITMNVPSRKKSSASTKESVILYHFYEDGPNILLPARGGDIPIQERPDLLPFYIDNGEVGRVVNGVYVRKEYVSAKDAVCAVYGKIEVAKDFVSSGTGKKSNKITLVDCPQGGTSQSGIIRYEDPRKAW